MPAEKLETEASKLETEPKMERAEPLVRKWTSRTAEYGVDVRKIPRKDGLFRVRSLENQAVCFLVDLNAKTCTCPDFAQGAKCRHIEIVEKLGEIRHQKRREYDRGYRRKNRKKISAQRREYYLRNRDRELEANRGYYQKNKEKCREQARGYRRERYHSDPEFRERQLEATRDRNLKYRKAFKMFKIESGGKCLACGESDLDVLTFHHPDGKREKIGFIKTKEFRGWIKYGIKPNIVLVCANCHLKLHTLEARGELNG